MTDSNSENEIAARFAPALDDLVQRATVTDHIVDKDLYRILVCTLWVNVVLDPADVGLEESDLERLHDVMNTRIAAVLGRDGTLTDCFRYLNGKAGEQAMKAARLTPNHRDMLLYFASIILDPEGHRQWMEEIRQHPSR